MNAITRIRTAIAVLRAKPTPTRLPQHLESRLISLAVEIEHLQERVTTVEGRTAGLVTSVVDLNARVTRATETRQQS